MRVDLFKETFPYSLCAEKLISTQINPHCANKYWGHKTWKISWTSSWALKYFPMFIYWKIHSMSNRALSKFINYYAVWSEVTFTELKYCVAKWEHKNPSKKALWITFIKKNILSRNVLLKKIPGKHKVWNITKLIIVLSCKILYKLKFSKIQYSYTSIFNNY